MLHGGYHSIKLTSSKEEPIRIARQLVEIEALIKRLSVVVDAVENHGYESKCLSGVVAVAKCPGQKLYSESLSLAILCDTEPCKDRRWQHSAREFLRDLCGKITKVNLTGRKRVVANNHTRIVQQDSGRRQVFVLMLKGFRLQPVIDFVLTTGKRPSRMRFVETLKAIAQGELYITHNSPRITLPSFFCAPVSFTGEFRASQKANCSAGVSAIVCSAAATTSLRA